MSDYHDRLVFNTKCFRFLKLCDHVMLIKCYLLYSLIPRPSGGGRELRPGTHCAHVRVIIAKCTQENSGCVLKMS